MNPDGIKSTVRPDIQILRELDGYVDGWESSALHIGLSWETRQAYLKNAQQAKELRLAVAVVIAERDALMSVLVEFQDGRRISNLHTRQVARDIQQQAFERLKVNS